ncbi:hypothetical protein MTR_8g035970 [Medicago truncatula]|uniref:Uncharacterized protein n=1 Tax=Medicago truncatula TaxID=3880 RepID=G7ZXP7_MEDTR|nr:hypothetical protein MTR_8g035970 [Medicago truncatula]
MTFGFPPSITLVHLHGDTDIKGQPGALKLPHTQGPGRGPTIWCIVRSLTLFLHKRLFLGLEPVTLQSHDNNFTSCAEVTPHGDTDIPLEKLALFGDSDNFP